MSTSPQVLQEAFDAPHDEVVRRLRREARTQARELREGLQLMISLSFDQQELRTKDERTESAALDRSSGAR